jgi:ABC-type uncharacterized transport system fused permease/ATPase subunit
VKLPSLSCLYVIIYFLCIVSYLLIGLSLFWLYFPSSASSSQTSSRIATGSYACLYLISSFSTIVNAFESVSEILAYSFRIEQIICSYETKDQLTIRPTATQHFDCIVSNDIYSKDNNLYIPLATTSLIESPLSSNYPEFGIALTTGVHLSVNNVDIMSKSGVLLIKGLSLQLQENMRLLVTGPSGIGKSSFISALAGLLCFEGLSSSIHYSLSIEDVIFSPQAAYCCDVS